MTDAWPLDLVLVIVLLAYLVSGWRRGFAHSVFVLAGLVAGGVAAYFAIPLVGRWVPDPGWRVFTTVAVAITLVVFGHGIGAMLGRSIRSRLKKTPLGPLDRLLGAVVNGVAAALIAALIALSIAPLGIPVLSQAIGSSVVLRAIDANTPAPVKTALAQLRSAVVDNGIPLITEALGGVTTSPSIPLADTGTDALNEAAESVVRITGNAYQCGQNQSGTGFVIADDRVVTNAHVVAGVTEPVVELPGGGALPGRIVYFDPIDDIAVIAVDDLPTAVLPTAGTLATGTTGVVDGYPYGGPFSTGPAEVLSVATANIDDIYGQSASPREIYTLAADVREGNSGGPLLTESGEVVGLVFAKSADLDNLGYAMTMTELGPVIEQAASLSAATTSGTCVRG